MAKLKEGQGQETPALPRKWANRIVRQGEADPTSLMANPNNWRLHGELQGKALEGVLDGVGWIQNVIVNETTGHIVDGHLRVKLAVENGEALVPVVYVELTEEEERLALTSIDPIAALAETDQRALSALTDKVLQEQNDPRIVALIQQITTSNILQGGKSQNPGGEQPEVVISPELFERHDYIVVLVDNEFDWQVLCQHLGLQTVDSAPVGKTTLGRRGVGRVILAQNLLKLMGLEGREGELPDWPAAAEEEGEEAG